MQFWVGLCRGRPCYFSICVEYLKESLSLTCKKQNSPCSKAFIHRAKSFYMLKLQMYHKQLMIQSQQYKITIVDSKYEYNDILLLSVVATN